MVSTEAEQRRQRFLAAKAAAGGDFADLMQEVKNRKTTVYFDSEGTLTCITQEPATDIDPSWHSYEFTDDELSMLEGKNWNLFYVKTHSLVDNLYSIERRPLESQYVTAEESFLSEVKPSNSKQWQVQCALTAEQFTVTLCEDVLAQYQNLPLENITANGQKVLKFYFTAPGDPHYLLHSEYISLSKLISEGSVSVPMRTDLTGCGVYTVKLFDGYQLNL